MIWLIFAHFIGDFALQKEWIALNKGKYWYTMLCHGMIWTACICVALRYTGNFEEWKIYFLLTGHIICDQWKCHAIDEFPTWHFYVDQFWHIVQCYIVYNF